MSPLTDPSWIASSPTSAIVRATELHDLVRRESPPEAPRGAYRERKGLAAAATRADAVGTTRVEPWWRRLVLPRRY